MKRSLDDGKIDRLLRLLNGNAVAANYWDRMGFEVDMTCTHLAEEYAEYGATHDDFSSDTALVSFMAGEWAERIRNQVPRDGAGLILYRDESERPLAVHDLPQLLQSLAFRGTLWNVRRCSECSKWMFARRKDQAVCSARCRQIRHEKTPEAKGRRNAYMRWRYAMRDAKEWVAVRNKPTFDQWREHEEPTPREWERIVKRRKK